jgi:superfamily II DNA/RNA helicase
MQSAEVIEKGVAAVGLRSTCIYGGVPKFEQKKVLRQGTALFLMRYT